MSQNPAPQNSNVFKYATIALTAMLAIGTGAWYVSSNNKKQATAEAALATAKAELEAQKAALGAQKEKEAANRSLVAQKSSALYADYMKKAIAGRLTATTIRKTSEFLQTALRKDPSMATAGEFDIRQALTQASKYYAEAIKLRESLDLRDIDADLVAYLDKNVALDRATKEALEDYAATAVKPDEDIVRIASRREKLIENEEPKLIAKFKESYGVNLKTSEQFASDAKATLDAQSKTFIEGMTTSQLSQLLIGKSFTNLSDPSRRKWRLEAAQFVNGSFDQKKGSDGIAFVMAKIEVRDRRNNSTGLLQAIVFFAKPADVDTLNWPIILSWCP
jgi:hypothetical protein